MLIAYSFQGFSNTHKVPVPLPFNGSTYLLTMSNNHRQPSMWAKTCKVLLTTQAFKKTFDANPLPVSIIQQLEEFEFDIKY
ncbi:hypothetical protein CMI37_07980 [Candidatus Pacearchaeota archaeon]|nr:hypothetical protein [Candidatus Pacearchaeota archaeon]